MTDASGRRRTLKNFDDSIEEITGFDHPPLKDQEYSTIAEELCSAIDTVQMPNCLHLIVQMI